MPPKSRLSRTHSASESRSSSTAGSTTPAGRLDTINPRPQSSLGPRSTPATPGSSSRGRFAPKMVARRAKDELNAMAPSSAASGLSERDMKSGRGIGNHPLSSQDQQRGGRGGRGRGRGRGRFEPVANPAIGPLAAPFIANTRPSNASPITYVDSSRTSNSPSPSLEFLAATRRPKSETPGIEVEDEDDYKEGRIDMTRSDTRFSDNPLLAAYFPVRLDRDSNDTEKNLEFLHSQSNKENERLQNNNHEESEESKIKIKSEYREDLLSTVQQRDTSSKNEASFITPEEQLESKRASADDEAMGKEFNVTPSGQDSTAPSEIEQRLYFLQFPVVMPEFHVAQTTEEARSGQGENEVDAMIIDDDEPIPSIKEEETSGPSSETSNASQLARRFPEGLAGKLRVHQSGKLSMVLGNITMEVSQGTMSQFLQDIVVMDKDHQKAYLMGQVTRKLIVSPDINDLLA